MMPSLRRTVRVILRVAIAGVCCLGIWNSWKIARADYLFQKDTEDSVRAAIRLVPDGWEYYMRLAQFDREHARDLLDTAVHLDPYNAEADIELGLQYEAEGNLELAEKSLLAAFDVDHTYLPRWSLANYYFRRDNLPAFWTWARSAATVPSDDVGPLFELCWRVSADPAIITAAILNDRPELIRQYVGFLLAKDQLRAVADVASRLLRFGDEGSDRPLLFSVIDRLVNANDAESSNALWHSLIREKWVVADSSAPNNATFARVSLPVSFDWSEPEYPGLHSWPGASGLETEFTGSQPEECVVAEQAVVLKPGKYKLDYAYRTSDIPPGTGIRWQVVDAKSNTTLADSTDLSSDTTQSSSLQFSVPPGDALVRLSLGYHRALGTPRISGSLVVISTEIEGLPSL
jgi:hypothetical protein